jgi:hypothetical protein
MSVRRAGFKADSHLKTQVWVGCKRVANPRYSNISNVLLASSANKIEKCGLIASAPSRY